MTDLLAKRDHPNRKNVASVLSILTDKSVAHKKAQYDAGLIEKHAKQIQGLSY